MAQLEMDLFKQTEFKILCSHKLHYATLDFIALA